MGKWSSLKSNALTATRYSLVQETEQEKLASAGGTIIARKIAKIEPRLLPRRWSVLTLAVAPFSHESRKNSRNPNRDDTFAQNDALSQ